MSIKAYAWAKALKVGSPTLKAVLCAIADYADDQGRAWPSLDRVAADTEFSARAVRMAVAELAEIGLLTRQERFRPDGGRSSDVLTLQTHLSTPLERGATPLAPAATGVAGDAPPPAPAATPPSRTCAPRTTTELPLNSSEAIASGGEAADLPVLSDADRTWLQGKLNLQSCGSSSKEAGEIIGTALKLGHAHLAVLEATEFAVRAKTGDARRYVMGVLRDQKPGASPRASPSKGRRSGMINIALNDYGGTIQ